MASNLPKRVHSGQVRRVHRKLEEYRGTCSCGWQGVIWNRHAGALAETMKHIKRARGA